MPLLKPTKKKTYVKILLPPMYFIAVFTKLLLRNKVVNKSKYFIYAVKEIRLLDFGLRVRFGNHMGMVVNVFFLPCIL